MASIAIADRTADYNGLTPRSRPLGGTEMSVIYLAEALARRGHDVTCLTHAHDPVVHGGVRWDSLAARASEPHDVLLAVQHPDLLDVRRARRRAVWVVWPPYNVGRRWNTLRMWWHRPLPVFVSEYQRRIYPRWLPDARRSPLIPLGLPDDVRGRPAAVEAPPPVAIFASNPVRSLSWLIDLWGRRILPRVPKAELHIYGVRDYTYRYGAPWEETHARLGRFLPAECPAVTIASLKPHAPVSRTALWDAMRGSRVMLYGGHRAEAFCLAVAEAQALGVPAVVRPIAVMSERVRHGMTGFVESDEERFADRAVELLTSDARWREQHEAALVLQQGWTWDDVAAAFDAQVVARSL